MHTNTHTHTKFTNTTNNSPYKYHYSITILSTVQHNNIIINTEFEMIDNQVVAVGASVAQ